MIIAEDQTRQYREEGYFILESVLPPAHLELLRSEAQAAIDRTDAEMDRLGRDARAALDYHSENLDLSVFPLSSDEIHLSSLPI